MGASFLEMFKARLDMTWSNLTQLKISLLKAGGWTTCYLKSLSNSNYSIILQLYGSMKTPVFLEMVMSGDITQI